MAIVGIDLGTTNSLIAAFVDGKSTLIPNSHNEFLTPSVVSLNDDGEILVGRIAKERLINNPDLSTALFKRKMGSDTKINIGKIGKAGKLGIKSNTDQSSFLPEELSSFILRQLLEDAEKFLGEPVTEAVISVPAYFNAHQRAATKMAGTLSGIKVERLVNEPSAAALACRQKDDEIFIIFDFGGGTLDVSIVEIFDNVVNICAISGNNLLGGIDFDNVIVEAICRENKIDISAISPQEYQMLFRAAEKAKMELSDMEETLVTANIKRKNIEFHLTNDLMFRLSQRVLERLKKPIQSAVKDSGLHVSEISKCVLVGGSCHMPIVRNFLESLLRIPVTDSQDVDKIVATGLGIYVGIKDRASAVKDLILTDICPFSLNTSIHNARDHSKLLVHTMIPRNTTLPTNKTESFWTIKPGQTKIGININQGEEMYADDNIFLGRLEAEVPLNQQDTERIDLTFTYDINAILAVKVKVASTGVEHSLVLTGGGLALTDTQVEEYVSQIQNLKLAHHERRELLIEQAKRLYTESQDEMKKHIQEIILILEKTGEGGSIRRTNAELDSITAHLAELEKSSGKSDLFNEMPTFLKLIKGGLDE